MNDCPCFSIASTQSCSLGPLDLTVGSLFPATTSSIPIVTPNLVKHGVIPAELVLAPLSMLQFRSSRTSELTFVLSDPTKFTEPICVRMWFASTTL
jgi:cathepsin E